MNVTNGQIDEEARRFSGQGAVVLTAQKTTDAIQTVPSPLPVKEVKQKKKYVGVNVNDTSEILITDIKIEVDLSEIEFVSKYEPDNKLKFKLIEETLDKDTDRNN